jgi:hypothetical protein
MSLMSGRATFAVVRWQSERTLRPMVPCAVGLGFGYMLPDLARKVDPAQIHWWLVLIAAAGVLFAAFVGGSRRESNELTSLRYFAAPLYGRELARAHAILPCVYALAFVVGIVAGLGLDSVVFWRAAPAVAAPLVAALALGQPVAALISLSACLRRGWDRALYIGLAVAAGAAIELVGVLGGPVALAGDLLAAFVIGFAALRAFGETLARYDPA